MLARPPHAQGRLGPYLRILICPWMSVVDEATIMCPAARACSGAPPEHPGRISATSTACVAAQSRLFDRASLLYSPGVGEIDDHAVLAQLVGLAGEGSYRVEELPVASSGELGFDDREQLVELPAAGGAEHTVRTRFSPRQAAACR